MPEGSSNTSTQYSPCYYVLYTHVPESSSVSGWNSLLRPSLGVEPQGVLLMSTVAKIVQQLVANVNQGACVFLQE